MEPSLFDRTIRFLLPYMDNAADREALVKKALYGSPVLRAIDWTGPANTFTVRLVETLDKFGDVEIGLPATYVLLENLKPHLGEDRKEQISELLQGILDTPQAEKRTLPEALDTLLQTVRDPKASITLTSQQIKQIMQHKPADLTEYRLCRIAEWSEPRYQLDNRFVNLTLIHEQGEDAHGDRWQSQEQRRFNDLRDFLKEFADTPALVLLGAPGSGKSTLLRRLQLDEAIERLRDNGDGMSFFIQLNNYRDSDSPRDWLNNAWKRKYPHLPPLNQLLDKGKLLLLLDALNEMPHRSIGEYHEKVGLWKAFIQEIVPAGNRGIFSCRSLDYSASLSDSNLNVSQIEVQELNAEQVQIFLKTYTPVQADLIWNKLNGSSLLSLFQNPYFLHLLCEQPTHSLPKGRASLFTWIIRNRLKYEVEAKNELFKLGLFLTEQDLTKLTRTRDPWRDAFELPDDGILISSLSTLAYSMQEKELKPQGAEVSTSYANALSILNHERSQDIIKAGVALGVLDVDIANGTVMFAHQLWQEFFAARKLAKQPNPSLVHTEWHINKVSKSLEAEVAELIEGSSLLPLPPTGWEETTLTAAPMSNNPNVFVRDLISHNLALAAQCAASLEVAIDSELKGEIQQHLIARTQDTKADLRNRIAVGKTLGLLGDTRFKLNEDREKTGSYLLPPMVIIPSGRYIIGGDKNVSPLVAPQHDVRVSEFEIGIFHVTNAEYALFIKAGGYEEEQWWDTAAARKWRDIGGNTDQRDMWRSHKRVFKTMSDADFDQLVKNEKITNLQKADWTAIRDSQEATFEAWLLKQFPDVKHTQPAYWQDGRFNHPSQPVIGISWFEARAYANWLSVQSTQAFRLATECELEVMSRHRKKTTWTIPFMRFAANTKASRIGATTPVGVFNDATKDGVFDTQGNAYSWTSTEFRSYPYLADDGRENPDTFGVERVVRGGSWLSPHEAASTIIRLHYSPSMRLIGIGFRLARN